MNQNFLVLVNEPLPTEIMDFHCEVLPSVASQQFKKNSPQKTNVTLDNRVMNIIIVEKKGVHS